MKKIYLFLIGMLCCFPLWAETIHVPSPGDLQEALMDADFNGTQLKITGTLNGADLAVIHAAEGRLANVTELDLSEVKFTASDDCYASYKTDAYDCYLEYSSFYYSETCKRDSTHSSTMLGTGVTNIKVYSNNLAGLFAGSTTYQKIVLPKSLGKIGFAMFQESTVSEVVLPSGLTEIEERAFESTKLSEVTLPATCKTIDDYAFESSALNHINLENVTKLGKKTFAWSKLQGDITLGAVSEVPAECFHYCALSSVNFQKGLKNIGILAFSNNTMKSVSLPEGVEYIGSYAFNSSVLQAVDVPSSISYVGCGAFPKNCYGSFELVDGIYYIGHSAYDFTSDASLPTSIKFREGTIGVSENFSRATDKQKETIVSLIFPSSVKLIGDANYSLYYTKKGSFEQFTNLETVVLPEGLQTIQESTFEGCKSLKTINFPQNLRRIENYAFRGSGLTSITLGENLEHVGYDAFENCKNLYSMRIETPNSNGFDLDCPSVEKIVFGPKVSYVGAGLMSNQTSLIRIVFEEDDNTKAIPLVIGNDAFKGCSNLKLNSLPQRVVEVGSNAFENCSSIKLASLSLDGIKIGSYAFQGIKEISYLCLDQNLGQIGGKAFAEIGNIEEVYYDVPVLNHSSVFNCYFANSKIKKLTIGTHVTNIGMYVFYEVGLSSMVCESRKGLDDVRGLIFGANSFCRSYVSSLVLPEYDEQLPEGIELRIEDAFWDNSLKELKMPDYIPTYFSGYSFHRGQIEKLYLGSNTKFIGQDAFTENNLKWVDIPSSVEKMDVNAFDVEYLFMHGNLRRITDYPYWSGFRNNIVCPMGLKEYFRYWANEDYARVIGYDIELSEQTLAMKAGESKQLYADFKLEEEIPYISNVKFAWDSLNPDVAVVDDNGIVTALKDGIAQITVEASYKSTGFGKICFIYASDNTGIDRLQSRSSDINIEVCHGQIVISGAKENSKVSVYSLGGQCVRTTTEKTISGLASGIYVVIVENQKIKVVLP